VQTQKVSSGSERLGDEKSTESCPHFLPRAGSFNAMESLRSSCRLVVGLLPASEGCRSDQTGNSTPQYSQHIRTISCQECANMRYIRATILEVFGFSNARLGDLIAAYGVAAMLAYSPGDSPVDRFSTRSLLAVPLSAR
jgi:hypothetical protein